MDEDRELEATVQAALQVYRTVQRFNAEVVGPEVDRTHLGLNMPPEPEFRLGVKLVREEYHELLEAVGWYVTWMEELKRDPEVAFPDHEDAVDAVCDLMFVLYGLLLRLGVTPQQFAASWGEVVRANMAKKDGPTREDGKRLKPDGWTPPNIQRCLDEPDQVICELANRVGVRAGAAAPVVGG